MEKGDLVVFYTCDYALQAGKIIKVLKTVYHIECGKNRIFRIKKEDIIGKLVKE